MSSAFCPRLSDSLPPLSFLILPFFFPLSTLSKAHTCHQVFCASSSVSSASSYYYFFFVMHWSLKLGQSENGTQKRNPWDDNNNNKLVQASPLFSAFPLFLHCFFPFFPFTTSILLARTTNKAHKQHTRTHMCVILLRNGCLPDLIIISEIPAIPTPSFPLRP